MSSNQQASPDPAGEMPLPQLSITVFPWSMPMPQGGSMHTHGILLRDYFVAHAPAVPEWFHTTEPPKPPADAVRASQAMAYADAVDAWRAADAKERTLQRPGYWADEQMKRRGVMP